MFTVKALPLFALVAATTWAHAAADFTTIRRTAINLSDSTPVYLGSFTLPNNVVISGTVAASAVLDIEVAGSEYNFNEVYINPPTNVCTSNDTDANQAASIGFLGEHDDAGMSVEWATNHIVFGSSLLKAGTNQVMVCIRNVSGGAGSGVGNLDNITLRGAVLHYHTAP